MTRYDVVIGIDPDIEKSGVAILDRRKGSVSVCKLAFPELVDWVTCQCETCKAEDVSYTVSIEGGWLNESNWHVPKGASGHYGAAIGESVGRNQAVGMLAQQMLQHKDLKCEIIKPLPKTLRLGRKTLQLWKGKDGKITQEELIKVVARNGLHIQAGRMNQDQRDAVLIAMHTAGYMIP